MHEEEKILSKLKTFILSYCPISNEAFQLVASIAEFQKLERNEVLLSMGQVSKKLYYIHNGALIAYFTDDHGNTYNKNIFMEDHFAGSTVSALLNTPSEFTLQAIEDTSVLSLNHQQYKKLIYSNEELKNFYIAYLEKNWVIEKEQREISIVMQDASTRYEKLLNKYPDIDKRIPLQHIASNLGITPTQLSRIRKKLKEK